MTDLEDKEIQTQWDLIEIWLCVGSLMLSLCAFALKEPAEMVMLIRIPSECLPFRVDPELTAEIMHLVLSQD